MRFLILLFLALLVPALSFAGPLEDGIAADNHGDYDKALKLLKPLSDNGNPYAQEQLAEMYLFGTAKNSDKSVANDLFTSAFKQLLPLAKKGDVKAQLSLSLLYINGWSVNQSDVDALNWRRKAAETENSEAEDLMGWAYEEGRGVQRDDVEAAKWYKKAARHGDLSAKYSLGKFYDRGIGVKQDPSEAQQWFQMAENQVCAHEGIISACPESCSQSKSIKPIPWQSADIVDLRMVLDDPRAIEDVTFHDKGGMFMTIGTKNGPITDPPFEWRILPDGRLRIFDPFEDRPYSDLTLISRDEWTITALGRCNSIKKYNILNDPKKSAPTNPVH